MEYLFGCIGIFAPLRSPAPKITTKITDMAPSRSRRASLSPYGGNRKTVAAVGTCTSLSPKPQPYNPTFTKRTEDELSYFIWNGIRTGLFKSVDRFLDLHPHLYNYFPEPPPGKTKKRPIQKWICNKTRPGYCRDPDDLSKFRQPKPGEVPTKEEAPDAYAFIESFKKTRMSSDSDDELSISSPPQINEEPSASKKLPAAKPAAFVPDPPTFKKPPQRIITRNRQIMSSDPVIKILK